MTYTLPLPINPNSDKEEDVAKLKVVSDLPEFATLNITGNQGVLTLKKTTEDKKGEYEIILEIQAPLPMIEEVVSKNFTIKITITDPVPEYEFNDTEAVVEETPSPPPPAPT